MPFPGEKDLRPGGLPRAGDYNRATDSLFELDRAGAARPAGGSIGTSRDSGASIPLDGTSPGFWVRITGGTNPYTFQSVVRAGGVWVTLPGSAGWPEGTAYKPAREVNDVNNVPSGMIVWMEVDEKSGGYLFDSGSSVPCPPPPPPPPVGTSPPIYYCVNGVAVVASATPPHSFDCGPFDYKPDCSLCTPIGAGSGPNISDATGYTDPYTEGATVVLSLSKTGAVIGTVHWTIGPTDGSYGSISGTDTGTGNTFAPTISLDHALIGSTVDFLVQIYDSGLAGSHHELSITRTVNPPVIPVRSGAGNLTDSDAYRLTQANTPGGGFTLTLTVSALGRGFSWWRVANTGTGVLTINQTGGETINGGASVTVAAGANVTLYPDNLSTWKAL